MATGNKKNKPKRRSNAYESVATAVAKSVLGEPRKTPKNRHVLVGLVIASLVAGLLTLINCDRITNSAAAKEIRPDVSLHGWPLVFLDRRLESPPIFVAQRPNYDWLWPPVEGERRTVNYSYLAIDILIAVAIVGGTYFAVGQVVFRYDAWKKASLSNQSTD